MFPTITPEVLKYIYSQKNIPTFEEYFNKRYLEECKWYFEKPKFSIKYMIIMSNLRENLRKRCLEEYKKKYPYAPNIPTTNSTPFFNFKKVDNDEDTKSEIGDGFEVIENNNLENKEAVKPRRSARLKNKK